MPQIDDGSSETGPGRPLSSAWITLSVNEAHDVLNALKAWAEELAEGRSDPQWHAHVTDQSGNELTVAIRSAEDV